jgi:hypothetical protein
MLNLIFTSSPSISVTFRFHYPERTHWVETAVGIEYRERMVALARDEPIGFSRPAKERRVIRTKQP